MDAIRLRARASNGSLYHHFPTKSLLADALYALGKYEDARALYAKVLAAKPKGEKVVWALMQSGNCARHLHDYVGAVASYEQILNGHSTSPWCKDAEWWAAQIKWRLLWNETMKQQGVVATAAPAPAQ